jgi:putative ABC transport system substrate-binding protein
MASGDGHPAGRRPTGGEHHEAQQPAKVYRIGVLSLSDAAFDREALRQGLRELGYEEGRDFTLEVRPAEGRHERLAELAAELVRLPVDFIVTASTPGVRTAQHATTTLPIIAAGMGDPVESGLVASLAHPGGNITGSFFSATELNVKRLELLKEAVPGVTRVAVLLDAPGPTTPVLLDALGSAAQALGVELQPVAVHGPDDFERAFHAIVHAQAEALWQWHPRSEHGPPAACLVRLGPWAWALR